MRRSMLLLSGDPRVQGSLVRGWLRTSGSGHGGRELHL